MPDVSTWSAEEVRVSINLLSTESNYVNPKIENRKASRYSRQYFIISRYFKGNSLGIRDANRESGNVVCLLENRKKNMVKRELVLLEIGSKVLITAGLGSADGCSFWV